MISRYTRPTYKGDSINRREGILNYDTGNLYPYHTFNLYANCGILKTCADIYGKFIYGKGLPQNVWQVKVNPEGMTADKFMRAIIDDFKIHNGFAYWIGYNALFDMTIIKPVPFENCRLKTPDEFGNVNKIIYSENWRNSRLETIEYDIYTSDKESIAMQVGLSGGFNTWKGQIFYYGMEYPLNTFHSVVEDVVTDIQVKLGKNANAMTNFMASQIIEVPFLFENISKKAKEDFLSSLQEFQGFDNVSKLMILENPETDINGQPRKVTFHKVDLQNYRDIFEYTETSVQSNIRKNYLIPEIFINPVATGFSTEIMNDLYHYYNQITSLERQIFEEIAMKVLPNFVQSTDYSLQPLTYREATNG